MLKKRKKLIMILIVLALVVCCIIRPIVHWPFEEITIQYTIDNEIVSTRLEGKEAFKIWWVFNGKRLNWNISSQGAACGFGPKRAVTIGDTTYYISQDDCCVFQKKDSKNFYRFNSFEWKLLWEVFKAHGADSCGHY